MGSCALGLVSGGLDGLLATRLLRATGLPVRCLLFDTGFGWPHRRQAAERAAAAGDLPDLEIVDLFDDYLEAVVRAPRHRRGPGASRPIDCRVLMLRRADELARRRGIDLLFSGEVLGQAACGQTRADLLTIEREAGLTGRLLRPLSARLLPATSAELEGRVARDKLAGIHGRARRGQLELAERLGVPARLRSGDGCCRLADPTFARRLADYLAHQDRPPERKEVELLSLGRHFRVSWRCKVIVGRDGAESEMLAEQPCGWRGQAQVGGALGLLAGEVDDEAMNRAASILARYSRCPAGERCRVELAWRGRRRELDAKPAEPQELALWRI